MPIGQSYFFEKTKNEIKAVLDSSMETEQKRLKIGRLLKALADKYGNELANAIIEEFNLFTMNIQKGKV